LSFTLALAASAGAAEPSPREIRQQIDAVDKLVATGKLDDAAASLGKGIAGLEAMLAQPAPPAAFKLLADRAGKARAKLEKAGADVSALVIPSAPAGAPAPAGGARRPPAVAGVSFSRQVAPFLVATCGRCHVTGRKGDFQMATYAQLMNSAKVSPGMGNMSEIVEVILSGDMPPGGGRVSPNDVGMLVRWIDSGAACDGDPNADLATLARAGAAPAPAAEVAIPAAAPLKPGDVSFASEVAPILLQQCGNCHGGQDAEANLRMTSLETLIKGGGSGPAIMPGKGADSLLVKKLRGAAGIDGQRMPLGKPPLSDAQIATIAKWIDQGARIDLLSPKASLETVASAGRAQRLSDAELTKLRVNAGQTLWRRFIPEEAPVVELRPGFALMGNLPAARMETLATQAEDVATRVRAELGTGEGPMLKGGVVVYAFRKAYDYSELWQVVLESERPKGLTGHAAVAGDVAYGAFVLPAGEDEQETRLLLAEQLAAAALAGRGLPEWFCRGAGRVVASRVEPKAMLAQNWKRDAGAAVKELGSATDYFAGRSDPSASALAGGGFLGSLLSSGKLAQVVAAVDGGASFDEAFQKAFRSAPQQAFMTWASRNAGR
jgi:cytochrome c553